MLIRTLVGVPVLYAVTIVLSSHPAVSCIHMGPMSWLISAFFYAEVLKTEYPLF